MLAFVAAELVARAVWEPPLPQPGPELPEELHDLPALRSRYQLAQPNLRGVNAGALFETNSAGFRGRERTPEKPPGVFRIGVIGDSWAMGWGVAEEATYAHRLEQTLGGRDPTVEVLNFALAGVNARDAVERLHRVGLAFDPDLVIYGFTVNDVEGPSYRTTVPPPEAIGRAVRGSPYYLWRVLAPRYGSLAEVLWAPRGSYVYDLDQNYFENPKAWGDFTAALDRLATTTRERDACALMLIHTRLHFLNALHPYHRHYDAAAEAAEARGIPVVRTFDAFRGRKDRELWVLPADPHPGPEAHGILAEQLAAGLDALPERCGVPGAAGEERL